MSFFDDIQERITLKYGKFAANTHKGAVSTLLILNGRPLSKWINGQPHYGYVVVSSPDMPVVYKARLSAKLEKDLSNVTREYVDAPLKDVLNREATRFLLARWAATSGIEGRMERSVPNEFHFVESIEELGALHLETSEYEGIQMYVTDDKYIHEHNLMGMVYPKIIDTKFAGQLPFFAWVRYMLNDYMLMNNLELLEYYIQNRSRVNPEIAFNSTQILSEFVPYAMQFGSIPNPLLVPEVFGVLSEELRSIFVEGFSESDVIGIRGTRIGFGSTQKRAYYCTRGAVQKILRVSMASDPHIPGRPKIKELYSPKLFMGLMYNALWGSHATNELVPSQCFEPKLPWYMLVRDDMICGFDYCEPIVLPGVRMEQISFSQMLMYTYLASVTECLSVTAIHQADRILPVIEFDLNRVREGSLL